MNIIFLGLAVQLISMLFLVLRKRKTASVLAHSVMLAGLCIGLIAAISILFFGASAPLDTWSFPREWFRFDGLGLFFLFIIQLAAIPLTIYNYAYTKHYEGSRKPVRSFIFFFTLLIISTELVVLVNHAIVFLVCWEIMSTAAYLGMVFDREKKEVQTGSFYYLIISHAAVFILYLLFLLLHHFSDSWLFTSFRITPDSGIFYTVLPLLALAGFGMKAGFMPFHFWLPRAHPIAPSPLSAFLSGVIIKTGIYGLFRLFQWMQPSPEWLGWLLICAGLFSALFGVWYALSQHDLKRLLAYHSVENIGIIGIGLGLGFLGAAHHSTVIQALGFGGALLHTLNHAIFKSLLFTGSGIIQQNTGTLHIEALGGIVKKSKYLAFFFLIGSVAISGIPPLNGFISEFMIYSGFFKTARELQNYYPLLMLLTAVGLAFVGGLAVACFTKVNGIVFLGEERTSLPPFHVTGFEYTALGIFAVLCAAIGFYPAPIIAVLGNVLNDFLPSGDAFQPLQSIAWEQITIAFGAFAILFGLLYYWKKRRQYKFGERKSPAWGCGYEGLNPRMQYTASSFADELNTIPQTFLSYKKSASVPQNLFPEETHFHSHTEDTIDNRVIRPFFRKLSGFVSRIGFLSKTDLRYSIGLLLLTITLYCIIAFLWM